MTWLGRMHINQQATLATNKNVLSGEVLEKHSPGPDEKLSDKYGTLLHKVSSPHPPPNPLLRWTLNWMQLRCVGFVQLLVGQVFELTLSASPFFEHDRTGEKSVTSHKSSYQCFTMLFATTTTPSGNLHDVLMFATFNNLPEFDWAVHCSIISSFQMLSAMHFKRMIATSKLQGPAAYGTAIESILTPRSLQNSMELVNRAVSHHLLSKNLIFKSLPQIGGIEASRRLLRSCGRLARSKGQDCASIKPLWSS